MDGHQIERDARERPLCDVLLTNFSYLYSYRNHLLGSFVSFVGGFIAFVQQEIARVVNC